MARSLHKRSIQQPAADVATMPAQAHLPALIVMRFDPQHQVRLRGFHAHDHLALGYFEGDGGWVRFPGQHRQLRAGDVFVIRPGEPLDASGLTEATGWAAFFSPTVMSSADALLAWQTHPLLYPFVSGGERHPLHGRVGARHRDWWSDRFGELSAELRDRQPGHREAAIAQLTLLLVAVTRLFADVVGQFRSANEPLLAAVFDTIERGFHQGLKLQDVARSVGMSPGYLTTVVRRRTGRTVQSWIEARRMAEARQRLATTDDSIEDLAHQLGYADGPHFVRQFKRFHGSTPAAWRRIARS